jgi:hypothetical protein
MIEQIAQAMATAEVTGQAVVITAEGVSLITQEEAGGLIADLSKD